MTKQLVNNMKHTCEHLHDCMKTIQAVLDGEATPQQIAHFRENIEECRPCIEHYHIEKCVKESLRDKVAKKCCPESILKTIQNQLNFNPSIL